MTKVPLGALALLVALIFGAAASAAAAQPVASDARALEPFHSDASMGHAR